MAVNEVMPNNQIVNENYVGQQVGQSIRQLHD